MEPPTVLLPTMQQQYLYDVVRRFVERGTGAALVVAARRCDRSAVEASLCFFLADFLDARYTEILYSTNQMRRASECMARQLTDYELEVASLGMYQYVQRRIALAEPPQQTHPDFVERRHRLLIKRRTAQDLEPEQAYDLVLYDDLDRAEFRHLAKQRSHARRILILYHDDAVPRHDDRATVGEARSLARCDPSVFFYDMQCAV